MLAKIKQFAGYLYGLVILVLVALYSIQKRKTEQVESELNHEKADSGIKLNEQARQAAKSNADALLAEYERLKRERGGS